MVWNPLRIFRRRTPEAPAQPQQAPQASTGRAGRRSPSSSQPPQAPQTPQDPRIAINNFLTQADNFERQGDQSAANGELRNALNFYRQAGGIYQILNENYDYSSIPITYQRVADGTRQISRKIRQTQIMIRSQGSQGPPGSQGRRVRRGPPGTPAGGQPHGRVVIIEPRESTLEKLSDAKKFSGEYLIDVPSPPYIFRWFLYDENGRNLGMIHEEETNGTTTSFSSADKENLDALTGQITIVLVCYGKMKEGESPKPVGSGEKIITLTQVRRAKMEKLGSQRRLYTAGQQKALRAGGKTVSTAAGAPGSILTGAAGGRQVYNENKLPPSAMWPKLRRIINYGKARLHKRAKQIYNEYMSTRSNDIGKATEEYNTTVKNLKKARDDYNKLLRDLKRHPEAKKVKGGLTIPDTPIGAEAEVETTAGETVQGQINRASQEVKIWDAREKAAKTKLNSAMDLRGLSEKLKTDLDTEADTIAKELAFQHDLTDKEGGALGGALKTEAGHLARYYTNVGKNVMTRYLGWVGQSMRWASDKSTVLSDVWHSTIAQLWELLMGPWVIGALFIILQFFFMLTYIGYDFWYLYLLPIVAGGILLVIKWQDGKYPLQFLEFLITGVMIGQSTIILLMALHVNEIDVINRFWFIVIWFVVAVFLGMFQIYQIGEFRAVFQIAILVLLFGYLALGPYHGYYDYFKGEVKKPIVIAWRALSDAFQNAWLLATNPTEWYARQQTINVRPEKPIDWPHALEINRLDALPPSVPASNPFHDCLPPSTFALATVIKNEGDMDATNIETQISCNEWCNVNKMTSTKYEQMLRPGEGQVVQFQDLAAYCPEREHAAEFRMAKVFVNFTYTYRTNSTLQVQVMSRQEMLRQFAEGKDIYTNVPAVAKIGPAQLSLNVGPQPLQAGMTKTLLLVSISNTRPDGYIILEPGTQVKVTLPISIGSGLKCAGALTTKEGDNEVSVTRVSERLTIKPYEFNTIFSFICTFDVNLNITEIRTGLIRAELPSYRFTVTKDKDIPISIPLGIYASGSGTGTGTAGESECTAVEKKMNDLNSIDSKITELVQKNFTINGQSKSLVSLTDNDVNKARAMMAANAYPIYIPAGGGQSIVGTSVTEEQIKNFLDKYDRSPLKGNEKIIYDEGVAAQIDPAFAIAIANKETSLGIATCGGISQDCHNYFCMEGYGEYTKTGQRWACFPDLQTAFKEFYRNIKDNYVAKGQDTIPEINCQPGTEFENSNHCYEEGKHASWVSDVESVRQQVQSQSTTTQPIYTHGGLKERYLKWKEGDQPVMEGTPLMHITEDEFTSAGCISIAAYSAMRQDEEIECAVLILLKNQTKRTLILESYSYQKWLTCIETRAAFGVGGDYVWPTRKTTGEATGSASQCFKNYYVKEPRYSCGIDSTGELSDQLYDIHSGLDIGVPVGTTVVAVGDGKIIAADSSGQCKLPNNQGGSDYGQCVLIEHSIQTGTALAGLIKVEQKFYTLYAHLSSVSVTTNSALPTAVTKGAKIGESGNPGGGAHLHIELRKPPGRYCNDALNPCTLWPEECKTRFTRTDGQGDSQHQCKSA